MKKVLFATLLFLCFSFFAIAQKSYDAVYSSPLSEVLISLEEKNDIVFSYDDDKVKNLTIDVAAGDYTLQEILQSVFNQTDLQFEFIDNKYILITSKKRQNPIDFLCGYVKDGYSNEPIAFASIYNDSKSKGIESDADGYFKVDISEYDRSIFVSFLGYQTLEIDLEKASNNPCQEYVLQLESISFSPVILKEYLADGINQTENANTIVIEPDEMNVLPGSVEKDVLSAITFLPGITSPGESLDEIHVRGGTPDQNLILWDGIPIYHTSHLFGKISAFNPNIIDHVDVYRSGIGSEFGGRVSSVIDIHSKQEIAKKFEANIGFNLTHIHFNFDVPLWKNSSLMIASRRSITDIWNTPTFVRYAEQVFQGTLVEDGDFNSPDLQFSDKFKFNDGNFKWMMDYGKNKFRFTSLGTLNSLNYKSRVDQTQLFTVDELNLTNAGAIFSWERQWNPRFKSKLEFSNSEFKNDYDLSLNRNNVDTLPNFPFSLVSKNSISDGGLHWKNDYTINEKQSVKFGYQFTENKTFLDIESLNRQDSSDIKLNFRNVLHALYGEYSLQLPKTLQLDLGLRYLYSDIFKNNYFEPRIALVTDVTDQLKLKISTGKHFQFVSQLIPFNTNRLGFSNQFWVAAKNAEEGNEDDFTIPVIESNQWMGGFIYKKGNWTLDVEGYVKELAGITTISSSFFDPGTAKFSSGNARTRGIDFLLKKRYKNYRNWISYSFSKNKYEFKQISLDPIPATHDQTHIFKWVHLYKKNAFQFSFGIEYRSGLPATEAFLEDNKPIPGELNNLRLKRYFRLDGSIIYNFGSPDKVKGFIALSFQNLQNRDNILGRSYIVDNQNGLNNPVLLPINENGLKFTPNLSVNIQMN